MEYSVTFGVMPALSFGVPQTRKRLILIASRVVKTSLPKLNNNQPITTVKDWIANLPEIKAGETHNDDLDHQVPSLSDINLKRIMATPEGGSRKSWPKKLWLDCHKKSNGHSDVYGRLSWNKPASGLTTRCISYSNGRFGHPEQNRAISIREAACLQTFPRHYRFFGSMQSKAKQIGNAVPPLMAKSIGLHIINLLGQNMFKS